MFSISPATALRNSRAADIATRRHINGATAAQVTRTNCAAAPVWQAVQGGASREPSYARRNSCVPDANATAALVARERSSGWVPGGFCPHATVHDLQHRLSATCCQARVGVDDACVHRQNSPTRTKLPYRRRFVGHNASARSAPWMSTTGSRTSDARRCPCV
jgi:hypothetical protein